tara:strand:- start:114 stop:917 length:804 start_codon:yes stop_codon:yes gene_type:complete
MLLTHLAVIAIVQGITEFLPISSSGHLALIPPLTGWPDHGLAVDIAAHSGSLCAVLIYFHNDIISVGRGLADLGMGHRSANTKFLGFLTIACAPTILGGSALVLIKPDLFRHVEIIAWATVIGAAALYLADQMARNQRTLDQMKFSHAALVGLFQVLALIPGASRAGVTITAARLCGYSRADSARFSMLTAIPIIMAACGYNILILLKDGTYELLTPILITGVLSFLASLAAIAAMMKWIRGASFTPLIVYRLLLGIALLAWTYNIH